MTYGEIVNNLRICSRCDFGQDCNGCTQDSNDAFCCDILLHKAADAIEELDDICQHQADEIRELRKAVLRLEDESGIYDELPTFYIYPAKWISVADRLPNGNGEYLVSGKGKVWVCEFMILGGVGGWCNSAKNPCVKYWMPLPEAPKEGE